MSPRRPYDTVLRRRESRVVNQSAKWPLVTQMARVSLKFWQEPSREFPIDVNPSTLVRVTTSRGTNIYDARLTPDNAPEILRLAEQYENTGLPPKHFRRVRAPLPPTPPQMAGGGPMPRSDKSQPLTSPTRQPSTRNVKE